jgi:glycerophosphoryl diester phosphodiesterase
MRPRHLYAHRGACAELPENTLQAFRRALDVGATAIETDAHVTKDGVLVLSHDPSAGRMAGHASRIAEHSLAEVRAWDVGWGFLDDARGRPFEGRGFRVPTLEEALAEFPGVTFNVDVKTWGEEAAAAAVAVARKAGAEDRVRLASFDVATLRAVRATGYSGETGLAQREVVRLAFAPRWLLTAFPLGGHAAQLPRHAGPFRFDTRTFTGKCHALGLRVDYWVIDDPVEAERLLDLGADGIMTDDPARIAPVFRAAK